MRLPHVPRSWSMCSGVQPGRWLRLCEATRLGGSGRVLFCRQSNQQRGTKQPATSNQQRNPSISPSKKCASATPYSPAQPGAVLVPPSWRVSPVSAAAWRVTGSQAQPGRKTKKAPPGRAAWWGILFKATLETMQLYQLLLWHSGRSLARLADSCYLGLGHTVHRVF